MVKKKEVNIIVSKKRKREGEMAVEDVQKMPVKKIRRLSIMAPSSLRRDENKYWDTITSAQNMTTANQQPILLNGIAQGDGLGQRQGALINASSILVRSTVTLTAAATNTQSAARQIIFYDRNPNGAVATTDDLLQSAPFWLSPLEVHNRDRFWVLSDKMIDLTRGGNSSVSLKVRVGKLKTTCNYSGTGATIASLATGAFYVLWLTSTGGDAQPTVLDMYTRFNYYDP